MNAETYFIKEKNDIWTPNFNVPFTDILEKNKVYADGYFTKKFYSAILWLLKKMNLKCDLVEANKETFIYKKYKINERNLMSVLKDSMIDMEYAWNESPKYLVIGNDKLNQLMRDYPENFSVVDMELQLCINKMEMNEFANFGKGAYEPIKEIKFWGFKVIMVPWIDGCFFLPDF